MQADTMATGWPSLRNRGIIQDNDTFAYEQGRFLCEICRNSTLVFFASYLVLFFAMSLRPNIYDEGIVLTASMRVAMGQTPHRDFYVLYGPAQYYVLAGLFKSFGTSILVERLFDLLTKALLVAAVFAIASFYCRTLVAAGASAVTFFWIFGVMNVYCGNALLPISLLNLIGAALVVAVFRSRVTTRRMLAAGAVAGTVTLFRYDTGIALLGIQGCAIAIGTFASVRGLSTRLRVFASTFGPCLVGFGVMVLPPAIYYLSIASIHPLINDIFVYAIKYYHRARKLPFPPLSLSHFDQSAIYTVVVIILIAISVAAIPRFRIRSNNVHNSEHTTAKQSYQGFLIVFGLLALGMYYKGLVRVNLAALLLSIIPSSLLLAILIEYRSAFSRAVRVSTACFGCLFVSSAIWSARLEVGNLRSQTSSVAHLAKRIILNRTSPPILIEWCKSANPLTRGICFVTDDGRIQTIKFIRNHTMPGQKLFVGQTRHDRIFENDNLIYFATERLPATKWSDFNPDVQDRYDVQAEIVNELDSSAPPYIVRDSEFDSVREPNDSSRSSGVTLLDDYLRNEYKHVDTFGTMSVWQRKR
jgi:hypothetical protein